MSNLTFKELWERIEKNDNRSTAQPYLLFLQQKKKYVSHDEYNWNTETIYRFSQTEMQSESKYDLEKELLREGWTKKEIEKGIEEFQMGHYWETENVFLTDKGYEDHMRLNGHNVTRGSGHRTYGTHAFRNPEINKMFEAIKLCAEREDQEEKNAKALDALAGIVLHCSNLNVPIDLKDIEAIREALEGEK